MKRIEFAGWGLFIIFVTSFFGGIIGGFLGIGVLDNVLFNNGKTAREIVLRESSVIIDVADKLRTSVVSISTESQSRVDIFGREFEGNTSAGTGLIISDDGLILTNKHVVPEDTKITVVNTNGTVYKDVEVVGRDPFNDLAYLRVKTDAKLDPATLGDSDQVLVGQKVIAIGNALGEFNNTVTSGIISGIGRPLIASSGGGSSFEQLQGLFQTDAAINPGNSGGPLVNIEGQVIGINTAVAGNAENIGFAIPINQVKAGLESIRSTGRLIKPYIGVRYVTLTPEIALQEKLSVKSGAYVASSGQAPAVVPGGPADKAGIKAGDVIVRVNGQEISDQNGLAVAIGRLQVGNEVSVEVVRGDKRQTFKLKLEEVPTQLQR